MICKSGSTQNFRNSGVNFEVKLWKKSLLRSAKDADSFVKASYSRERNFFWDSSQRRLHLERICSLIMVRISRSASHSGFGGSMLTGILVSPASLKGCCARETWKYRGVDKARNQKVQAGGNDQLF